LKPENFIFETDDINSDLKIIDFGLSKILKQQGGGTGLEKIKNFESMKT